VAADVDDQDFALADFQLQRDPILHRDRYRVQPLQLPLQCIQSQRRVVRVAFQNQQRLVMA